MIKHFLNLLKILTAHSLLKINDEEDQWQEYWEDEQELRFKDYIFGLRNYYSNIYK